MLTLLSSPSPEDEDHLYLGKDGSHNSSFELAGSMITSYQPVSHQRSAGRSISNYSIFRSPSPFKPSFLGSASKVRYKNTILGAPKYHQQGIEFSPFSLKLWLYYRIVTSHLFPLLSELWKAV